MKKVLMLVCSCFIFGCSSTFVAKVHNTPKRMSGKPVNVTSMGNRLSVYATSGQEVPYYHGVFVNPACHRVPLFNDLDEVYFVLYHYFPKENTEDKLLPIKKFELTLDGKETIQLSFLSSYYKYKIGNYDKLNLTSSWFNELEERIIGKLDTQESAIAKISLSDYEKIINAQSITAKITNNERIFFFSEKDIEDDFIPNLRYFYQRHIKPYE